ncbi:hypothetical protein ABI59_00880 [Acidobacteria bacterium Mor1]|nr:hypothetical protein ABI59_00880 [Acidobacteria bacterium Mor1]
MEFARSADPRDDWPELYLEMLQADFVLVQGKIFVVPGGLRGGVAAADRTSPGGTIGRGS